MAATRAGSLRIDGLGATWDGSPVLRDISLTVAAGEFVVLMGPNGSGKSTLLRCLAGLEAPSAGRVWLDGVDITRMPPYRRGVGLLLQDPAMFPGRSVYENIAYGPLVHGRRLPEVEREILELLRLVRLEGFEDRNPMEISGGQRQRVALARALAARPRVLLLDEPFASLDVDLRAELRGDFRRVLTERGVTTIHVTHDREEGLFLGDRVALLFDGRLRQTGTSREVFEHPADPTAARFLGYNVVRFGGGVSAVHPRATRWNSSGDAGIPVEVIASGPVGPEGWIVARSESGDRLELPLSAGTSIPAPGTKGRVMWDRSIPLPASP